MQENVNLKPFHTFGMDVLTNYFASFTSIEELQFILKNNQNQPLLPLGGGSNILFRSNYKGIILSNRIKRKKIIHEDTNEVIVNVGAGEIWHEWVLFAIQNNWGGIENLSLIPGSVGASPMQNIGAYGVEIKDVFVDLEALEIKTRKIHHFTHSDCQFGYRESVFKKALKNQFIIISVTYRLQKNPLLNTNYGAIEKELSKNNLEHPTVKDVSNAVISIRQSKLPDPKKIGNAGSFFKNPVISKEKYREIKAKFPEIPSYPVDNNKVKIPAGWLIDKAGWKGKTFNNYGVHKKQALVLVNYGGCSGNDIYRLSEEIIADIERKYTIHLDREVNIID